MQYEQLWLDYAAYTPDTTGIPEVICVEGKLRDCVIVQSAIKEYSRAYKTWKGVKPEVILMDTGEPEEPALILASAQEDDTPDYGSYTIRKTGSCVRVTAASREGILYGVFKLLELIRTGRFAGLSEVSIKPTCPLRMLNHWDNMDNSIERGYAGLSFFFKDNRVVVNERTCDYARLLGSIGINAVVINNVNVKQEAVNLITPKFRNEIKELVRIFGEYGVKMYLSIDFASPMDIGGLELADPCDERVAKWWKDAAADLYKDIPDFGGFLVKADSEGRPGPFTYGRNHADGANMLADAVAPFGGTIIWRCFVYNCQQDWRDYKTDRARAAYDNFIGLDGLFRDNVILQIKNGPMDFQVREPVSPLFGGLRKTNEMIEFQIAQEYTGQQLHICYLIPMFKEILNFRTYIPDVAEGADTVESVVTGKTFGNSRCGIVAVTNTGSDANWSGSDMAVANLYGFGRLCFDLNTSVEEITEDWIKLYFGPDQAVLETVKKMLLESHAIYEQYTSPLGIGWMINPGHHYGPSVDGYEYSRWGTYHRADHHGMGVDRSMAGTGYVGQYNEPLKSIYGDPDKCPEELLLFFHYIRYDRMLSTGKTMIQHIYDTHFEGAARVDQMREAWKKLEGRVAPHIYKRVGERLDVQYESACEWRDHVNSYFYRKSDVRDMQGRVIY